MKIIFATNNPNKLKEIRQALGGNFELLSLADIGFDGEIPETGRTLEANAMQKATYIFERFRQPVFADDTGLEVLCLNRAPGVDTAHYSGSRDPERNMEKLLNAMSGCADRSARFRTVIAFVTAERKEMFEGLVEGKIADSKRGDDGFGYDPVFIPENADKTFGEMTIEEKAKTNHRVRALSVFTDFLEKTF
ncbi:MAG: RdgB/HAM1 family non-canonical purine NTP pyrophosphatase [Flavobacteriales bacterium]|nr:RdgB/HAM1 family non-canonical purine NTP pyrophosphatase [Flavobacteriales bacterium]